MKLDLEKIGSILFEEIYTARSCDFSRSNSQIYGMSNEQPTKILLSVMFKNIASKYEDRVVMVPLMKIGSSILHKLFNDVMNVITAIGYDVVVSLVDGRFSNVKFYKKEVCADKPTSFIPHPLYIDFYTSSMIQRISSNAFITIFKNTFFFSMREV